MACCALYARCRFVVRRRVSGEFGEGQAVTRSWDTDLLFNVLVIATVEALFRADAGSSGQSD